MRTRTRALVATAVALAVGASAFAVTSATRPDQVASLDAPLAVPPSTTETVAVLAPVADLPRRGEPDIADLTAQALGLSEEVGTARVTVPGSIEDASDDEGVGAPAPPGEDEALDAATTGVAPDLVAASLALDSVGGDAADLAGTEPSGAVDPASPSPDPDGPASDPCAPTEGDAPEGCPAGERATLLSLTGAGELQVWATADPVEGPDLGSSIYCAATEAAGGEGAAGELPVGALRLGALTTGEATVTVTYWPEANPGAATSAELSQVQLTVDGSARHCGHTAPLEAGRYEATAIAISPDGVIAEAWSFSFDARGAVTIPGMSVIPLGTNWLWVGVRHTVHETASIKGFALADGGVSTCVEASAAEIPSLRKDIGDHTSPISQEWLAARNFNGAYTRVTSALLYVPEGTDVGLCGYTFSSGDPSWDADVPDRVEMATASAPDTWEAIVAIDSVTTFRPGNVYVDGLTQMGGRCGTSVATTVVASTDDEPVTTVVGQELCRLSGQNVQLRFETFATDGSQDPTINTTGRFLIPTHTCEGTCPEPTPRAYMVYLPGLGLDECPGSAEGACAEARRTLGAFATITVMWDAGGEGGRERWSVGASVDQDVERAADAGIQFDLGSPVTRALAPDGLTGSLTASLSWDRAVDYSVRLVGTCFGREGTDAVPAAATGRATPNGTGIFSADVTFNGLCPGRPYQLVATATDDAGNGLVVSPAGVAGVAPDVIWYYGGGTMPQRHIELTATIEIFKSDRVNNAWLVRDTQLDILDDRVNPSYGYYLSDRCFAATDLAKTTAPASVTLPLATSYDIQPHINVVSDWYYYPVSPSCTWRAHEMWVSPTGVTVSLADLLAGAQFTGTLVPRSFPDVVENPIPFTYRVTVRAEHVDD